MIKFYDTCALLELQEEAFNDSKFYISSITLSELEQIKTSGTRDEETKWKARQVLNYLRQYRQSYEIVIFDKEVEAYLDDLQLISNNDNKIIVSAYMRDQNEPITFVTNDLACEAIASSVGLRTELTSDNIVDDDYTGYKIIKLSDEELADFYTNVLQTSQNKYNLLTNEYLLIKDNSNHIVDKYKWNNRYESIGFLKVESKMFGKVTPKDDLQLLALDALNNNQITMLRGKPGSGKSHLAFGHMFSLLDQGKIEKIIIFCNTVATKGSAKLGYYPGSRTEKLLDSQIGNFLESKLGSRIAVERLIEDEKIILLPMSDIRGYDTTGMNAAIYITEAQNLDIELMKLALQRIGEDSICILDGDDKTQVDMSMYAGSHNGMKRVSKVFRGASFYGEVTLQKIHRSRIAELAQQL